MKTCSSCLIDQRLDQFENGRSTCLTCRRTYARIRARDRRAGHLDANIPETKVCNHCGLNKPAADFCRKTKHADGLNAHCRDCAKEKKRLARYGVTLEQYREMVERQGGLCAICRQPDGMSLHVDHCHETNTVRGLLCGACNRGIGLLDDDPETLMSAARYITSSRLG